jgi:hypothetical protein
MGAAGGGGGGPNTELSVPSAIAEKHPGDNPTTGQPGFASYIHANTYNMYLCLYMYLPYQ